MFFYEARAKVLAKKPVEAAALLTKACQKQKVEGQDRSYVSRLVLDLDAAGLGMEGYRAIREKTDANAVTMTSAVTNRAAHSP